MRSVTTVDLADRGSEIAARADRISHGLSGVDWRRALLAAVLLLPFVLSCAVGTVARIAARVVVLAAAACAEGWSAGYRPSASRRQNGA